MEKNILAEFYHQMNEKSHKANASFVFVCNDDTTYKDDPHMEECYSKQERDEVIDSVSDLFDRTYCYGSELEFLAACDLLKQLGHTVYVYSMAQIIEGYSRRTLVPAICLLYGFINVNADPYMSAIGCNKATMFKILEQHSFGDYIAPSIYFHANTKIDGTQVRRICGDAIVIKPISESCCIDVIILHTYTEEKLSDAIRSLINKYMCCMVQRYIKGEEIGITIFFHNEEYYALQPIQIEFPSGRIHLTHTDSYYDNYNLTPCSVAPEILSVCSKMSRALEFRCITRYDFRFDGERYYLFDISPNPTLSDFSSCNYAARYTLHCDHRGIYRLLAFEKLQLFEPSF